MTTTIKILIIGFIMSAIGGLILDLTDLEYFGHVFLWIGILACIMSPAGEIE